MGKRRARNREKRAVMASGEAQPEELLPAAAVRLVHKLFGHDVTAQEKFLSALIKEDAARPAVITLSGKHPEQTSEVQTPWTPEWLRELDDSEGVEKHSITTSEAYLRGDWYVLDHSSVFCAAPLFSLPSATRASQNLRVLDLCASPGGKALLAWRALKPSLIVVNEPLPHRIKALISNVKRCRVDPCVVTRRDASQLCTELPHFFDVVVADAPCSGQSLRAKHMPSAGAFHASTINRCVKRQRHILSSARILVAPGGYLLYSTCTYGREENESMIEWFLARNPEWSAREVTTLKEFQSHLSREPSYRLWPFQGFGAGGFTCLLQAPLDWTVEDSKRRMPHLEWSSVGGRETLSQWLEQ
jgi:16S rRNA C967 or C1407 C5-methylase (RsmB/RsmF family)